VAAMQEAATPDRPLTKLTIVGAIVGAAGGTALGLAGDAQAASPSPPHRTNAAHARLKTFDMFHL